MSLNNISPSIVISKIEEFIEESKELSDLSYKEGREKKKDLDEDIRKFIRVAFTDSDEKLSNYNYAAITIIGHEKTPKEKQEDYENRVNHKREYLEDLKEEVELIQELKESNSGEVDLDNEAFSSIENSRISAGRDVIVNAKAEQNTNIKEYKGERKDVSLLEDYARFLDDRFEDNTVRVFGFLNFVVTLLSILVSATDILGVQLPSEFVIYGLAVAIVTLSLGSSLFAALKFKNRRTCEECNTKFSMREYKDPDVREIDREDEIEYRIKRYLKCKECGETDERTEREFEDKEDEQL